MAVLPMLRMDLCGLKKDRKKILEMLQRSGAIEITDEIEEDSVFHKTDTASAKALLEKGIASSRQALAVLNRYAPKSSSMFATLEGRKETTVEYYDQFGLQRDKILQLAYRLISLDKTRADRNAEIPKLRLQMEVLTPWMDFDIPLNFKGTKQTAAFIGMLPPQFTQQELDRRFREAEPGLEAVNIDVVSTSKEQTCVFILCKRNAAERVEEILRMLGFARPASGASVPPSAQKKQLEESVLRLQQEVKKTEDEIKSCAKQREALEFMLDYYTMRLEKYEVIDHLVQSRHTFVLTGYIPQREADALEDKLHAVFNLEVEFQQPAEEEDVPVLLQNNAFASPVESVVESYSLPGKGEMDPTGVMSIFYYALFGMMLSDAAYGLLLSVGCAACLLRFKNMEQGMRKSVKMLVYCGISTIFWGVLFGSYFGDVVDVVSKTFFGTHLTLPPVWFAPLNQPMRMLVFCFVIGLIHLFAGLAMNFYQLVRAKKYMDALYDVVFWYALIISLVLVLLSQKMFTDIVGLSFILPASVGNIGGVVAAVAAVGIVLTGGRESRNPFKRFLKGLYSLYNITGYLSDVLSYSRLLALGLATGVIASVINQMGGMVGNNPAGVVAFIIVFLFGHTMNIGINTLGAYVHTNRLQFVEFFGKFYSGGGRKFRPFAVNTKYYKFKEDHHNG